MSSARRTLMNLSVMSGTAAAARRVRASWSRIGPFLGVSRLQLALLGAASLAAGLVEASLLALIAALATALSAGQDRVEVALGPVGVDAALPVMFAAGFVLTVARATLHALMAYLPSLMSANAMANLRRRLFDAFTNSSWTVQASERDGYFQTLMTGHVGNVSLAVVTLGQAIGAFFMFMALLGAALTLSPLTAVLLMVLSSSLFMVMRPLSRRTGRYSKMLSEEATEYTKGIQEVVRLAEEAQVFGASASYRRSFHALIEHVRMPLYRTRFLGRLVPVLYQSVALAILLVALVVVSRLDATRLASLTAVVLILVRSLAYGNELQAAITKIHEMAPFMDKLREAIDRYHAHPRQDGSEPLTDVDRIGMERVHFEYSPGEEVLTDFSFEVTAGEAIGIVGPSGAGKSTLVQLLLRLRDPDSGSLFVNDVDARAIRRADWQRCVAYVPQSPQLMWGTVAENIRFYRAEVPDEDVERAARLAHIHDEIMSWPSGYDTVIGDRVAAVSGGQRQRLCLARALAARPKVLILDEPTSALDVKSEMLIQESLRSIKGDMVLFMVAHRLSTLSICDRVMVLVDGRLQAIDTPEDLNRGNPFFQEAIQITRQQSAVDAVQASS